MDTYRMSLLGALMMLGACSTAPPQPPHANAPVVVAAAPARPLAALPELTPAPKLAPQLAPTPVADAPPPVASPAPTAKMVRAATAARPAATSAPVKKAAPVRVASTSATLQLSGHVELAAARGQQVEAGEQADTMVYFVPDKGGIRAKPGHYTVYTHNRDFSPEAIAVPLGSTITFVNLDDVRHNVFSVTPGTAFDLGYQGAGEKADHSFARAGIVLVSCNVHHSMELDVLVVPSAYMAKVGADGNFSLAGLPAGAGTLHFWNPRAQPVSQQVSLPFSGSVSQRIVVARPRLTTALNAEDAR